MFTAAVVSQKGGSGKSTLSECLAVQAAVEGHKVALVDIDPQATCASWADRREANDVEVVAAPFSRLRAVLRGAAEQGFDVVIIDTPPRTSEPALVAAKAANLVLIPVQPTTNDLETLLALRNVIGLAGNPASYVVMSRALPRGPRHLEGMRAAELCEFEPCPEVIYQRSAYQDAPALGLSAPELEPRGKAAREITALWGFVSSHFSEKVAANG